jgi:alkanesulfonate monooxygenase SsuD/methylene tetrahydromethanopterin reductase-like flavin-dependent oxidoreductase (luciferase family)
MAIKGKRYWGVLAPQPAAQLIAYTKQSEAWGLEGLWGIQLPGPAFLPLATAAAATEHLKLGTGVALALPAVRWRRPCPPWTSTLLVAAE